MRSRNKRPYFASESFDLGVKDYAEGKPLDCEAWLRVKERSWLNRDAISRQYETGRLWAAERCGIKRRRKPTAPGDARSIPLRVLAEARETQGLKGPYLSKEIS